VQVLYVTATDGDLKGFNVRFASGACGYVIFDLSVTNSALNGFNVGFASDDYGYFVPYRKGAAHPARWRGSTCRPYRRCGCWT